MTEKQLLDFCKAQKWSARVERIEENFRSRLRIYNFIILNDIGIHDTRATISIEIDESTKEVTIDNGITFYGGVKKEDVLGKTYDARLQNDIEICNFLKNSVEAHKKFLSRSAKSTIIKLQNKIEQLQSEIERLKLII